MKSLFGTTTLLGLALMTACGESSPNTNTGAPASVAAITTRDLVLKTNEDKSKSASFDTDNPGNVALRYVVTQRPAHGTLKSDGSSFTYTPAADYHGDDRFSFAVEWDGGTDSGTVTLHVLPVNDLPSLASVSLPGGPFRAGSQIKAVPGAWADADDDAPQYLYTWLVNGVALSASPVADDTLPAAAVVKGNTIQVTAVPFDGTSNGAPVNSAITTIENTAPIAADLTADMNEDGPLLAGAVPLVIDPDLADTLTVEEESSDAAGTFGLSADGSFSFTPAPNWNGDFHFSYRVSDGTAWSNTASGTITVAAVNDAPTLTGVNLDGGAYVHGMTIATTPAGAGDIDGDPINYLYRWTINGSAVGVSSSTLPATYVTKGRSIRAFITPFDAADMGLEVSSTTVVVGNTAPLAPALNVATDEDLALTLALGSDVDAVDTLSYEIVTAPTYGSLSAVAAASVRYTPNINYNGSDSFAYRVSDGTVWTPVAIATLTINPVNDAPTFIMVVNNGQVVDPYGSATISGFGIDVDGDALSYSWLSDGVTIATGGSYSITASSTTHTQTNMTLRVSDGALHADTSVNIKTRGPGVDGLTVAPGAVTDTWTLTAATGSYTGQALSNVWWRIGGSVTVTGATTISWRSPGVAGIYQIEMKITDATGYTGFFTSAAAITTSTQWAGFGNDRQNTSQHWWVESLGGPVVAAPISPTGAVAAVFPVGGQAHLPLSLGVDGTLLGSRWADQFFAVRITDGVSRWTRSTFTYGAKPSVTTGGTAYFGENGAKLFALEELTGTTLWSATFGGGIYKDFPLGSDGRILKSSDSSKNYQAIHPETGVALWTVTLPSNLSTNAVVAADGTSYVGAGTTLYAVYANGTTSWSLTFPQGLIGVALASDGTIYTGGYDDTLYAVAATGAVKWSRNVGQDVQLPKIGADGTVYVKTTNGNLSAVSSTGTLRWQYGCLGTSAPAIGADGTIYLPAYGEFVALYPSGEVKWKYTLASNYFGSPVIDADGYVYAGASNGNIYKFK